MYRYQDKGVGNIHWDRLYIDANHIKMRRQKGVDHFCVQLLTTEIAEG